MPRAKTTTKSLETRERILRTAERLFREDGFHAATLRRIALEADVAVGLTHHYFAQKEDLVLALYGEIAEALDASMREMRPTTLATGWTSIMREKLRLIEPHREALAALFAASLTHDAVSVFGERAAPVREKVRGVFVRVVEQATDLDALDADARRELATTLYGVHLAIVLAWLVDRRRGGERAGSTLTNAVEELLSRSVPLLATPVLRQPLSRVATWLESFLSA